MGYLTTKTTKRGTMRAARHNEPLKMLDKNGDEALVVALEYGRFFEVKEVDDKLEPTGYMYMDSINLAVDFIDHLDKKFDLGINIDKDVRRLKVEFDDPDYITQDKIVKAFDENLKEFDPEGLNLGGILGFEQTDKTLNEYLGKFGINTRLERGLFGKDNSFGDIFESIGTSLRMNTDLGRFFDNPKFTDFDADIEYDDAFITMLAPDEGSMQADLIRKEIQSEPQDDMIVQVSGDITYLNGKLKSLLEDNKIEVDEVTAVNDIVKLIDDNQNSDKISLTAGTILHKPMHHKYAKELYNEDNLAIIKKYTNEDLAIFKNSDGIYESYDQMIEDKMSMYELLSVWDGKAPMATDILDKVNSQSLDAQRMFNAYSSHQGAHEVLMLDLNCKYDETEMEEVLNQLVNQDVLPDRYFEDGLNGQNGLPIEWSDNVTLHTPADISGFGYYGLSKTPDVEEIEGWFDVSELDVFSEIVADNSLATSPDIIVFDNDKIYTSIAKTTKPGVYHSGYDACDFESTIMENVAAKKRAVLKELDSAIADIDGPTDNTFDYLNL